MSSNLSTSNLRDMDKGKQPASSALSAPPSPEPSYEECRSWMLHYHRLGDAPVNEIPHHIRPRKVFTVGISGCSSSGKSTLALLLMDIFLREQYEKIPRAASHSGTGSFDAILDTLVTTQMSTINRDNEIVLGVVHQDEYFLNKKLAPPTVFETTSQDTWFVSRVIVTPNNERPKPECQYQIHAALDAPDWIRAKDEKYHKEENREPNSDAWFDYANLLKKWSIFGADVDCLEALNLVSMSSTLQDMNRSGSPPAVPINDQGKSFVEDVYDAIEEIRRRHAPLIKELRAKIITWAQMEALQNLQLKGYKGMHVRSTSKDATTESMNAKDHHLVSRICFVEGFMLFPNPGLQQNPRYAHKLMADEVPDIAWLPQHIGQTVAGFHARVGAKVAAYEEATAIADDIEVKLFLATPKPLAHARRFARACYRDADHPYISGTRLPGEMWKTDGYFHNVVWRNYERFYGWLLVPAAELAPTRDSSARLPPTPPSASEKHWPPSPASSSSILSFTDLLNLLDSSDSSLTRPAAAAAAEKYPPRPAPAPAPSTNSRSSPPHLHRRRALSATARARRAVDIRPESGAEQIETTLRWAVDRILARLSAAEAAGRHDYRQYLSLFESFPDANDDADDEAEDSDSRNADDDGSMADRSEYNSC